MIVNSHRTPVTAEGVAAHVRAGATMFELDLRLLGGRVVVTHFLPLHRGLPWVEHDGWSFRRRVPEPVAPSVAEVLGLMPDGVEVMLDLKDDVGEAGLLLAAAVAAGGFDPTCTVVASKNWPSLQAPASAGLRTLASVATARQRDLLLSGLPVVSGVTMRASLCSASVVQALHERGLQVLVWTVNDVASALRLQGLGVDGVTTDSVDVMRALTSPLPT